MAIRFFSDEISFQLKNKRKITQWLKLVAAEEGKTVSELCYIFVSNERILDINGTFLKHNYFTDIITFDESHENTISGEMYISIETVKSNAETYKTGFHDELLRVMVHGVLHMCGYGDKTEKEQQLMRAAETKYLNYLSV